MVTIRLVSSNPRKLAAFRALGLDIDMMTGVNLPEVDGSPDEVAVRKAEAAGAGTLVEDTILEVNGIPVVDIRWRIEHLAEAENARVLFVVTLAENDGEHIRLWRGVMEGAVGPRSTTDDAFGFDPWIYPDGAGGLSLDDLAKAGRTAEFSARAGAVHAYLTMEPLLTVALADLAPWSGGWQSSPAPPATATSPKP